MDAQAPDGGPVPPSRSPDDAPAREPIDDAAERAREFARALTIAAGVPVTVIRRARRNAASPYVKWDVCWSGGSPSVSAMSAHVASLAPRFPDIGTHVRYAWRAPSRRRR